MLWKALKWKYASLIKFFYTRIKLHGISQRILGAHFGACYTYKNPISTSAWMSNAFNKIKWDVAHKMQNEK